MTKHPKIPGGYRQLKVGEVIARGDQCNTGNGWYPTIMMIGFHVLHNGYPYIRKFKPKPTPTARRGKGVK